MTNIVLQVSDLKTYFYMTSGTVQAVDGIDLDIRERETVGLVGESGSGKSVTALSILRLVPIPGKIISGSVFFKEKDLLRLTEDEMRKIRGKGISVVFQDPFTFLNPVMKVKDQIAETILVHQEIKEMKEVEKRVIHLLNQMRIGSADEVKEYYPHQLSGGMRQRVVLAAALACNPDLLILDEPTTALDVTTQLQILDLLRNLKTERNLSILLITHDLGIVAEICDKVNIMYAGHIQESGDVYDIFEEPKHPYTSGLLQSAFSIDEFKPNVAFIDGNVPQLVNPPTGCRFHPRCPHAMEICKRERKSVKVGDHHFVNCWLYS